MILFLIVGIIVPLVFLALPVLWLCQKSALAESQVQVLQPMIRNDARFNAVDVGYELNGRLWIVGNVRSIADLTDLKQLVDSSNPPMEVSWNVDVK
jgi:hypothetical protein